MTLAFDVLCFASKEWRSHRQRPHWVAAGLAEHGARVLFVENMGTRLPQVREAGRVAKKVESWARTSARPPPRRTAEAVIVDSPLVVPLQHLAPVRAVGGRLLASRLSRRLRSDRPLVVWTYLPMPVVRDVAARLGASLLVYDWADDAATHVLSPSAAHRRRLARWEDEMAAAADLVLFSSAELQRRRGAAARHGVLVPHGAPPVRGGEARPVPAVVADRPHPRVGFVGSITEFTDLALIEAIAVARPEWTVLLVGPARVRLTRLRALPNVVITGEVPHDEVMAMLPALDAAFIAYRVTPATSSASPIKVHEYLAYGLPVVSVDIPEVRSLAPQVEIASEPEAFVAALDRAVAQGRRTGVGSRITWHQRVQEMIGHVDDALAAGMGAVARVPS